MKAQLRRLAERIDALSLRERLMVFGVVAVGIGAAWFIGFFEPMEKRLEQLEQRRERVQATVSALRLQSQAVVERAQQDPNRALRARQEALREDVQRLDALIDERTTGFVRPAQMAPLLRDLLQAQRGLRLLRVESLEPRPLQLGEENPPMPVYRHGLELEWEGDYFSTLRYLEALEALPWRLGWDVLEYEVLEHPRARVRLRVHTISLEKEWIGV